MADTNLRPIPAEWLVSRIEPHGPDLHWARETVAERWQPGDEVWEFDEPAPPGINAGETGLALVRGGVPIHSRTSGIQLTKPDARVEAEPADASTLLVIDTCDVASSARQSARRPSFGTRLAQ